MTRAFVVLSICAVLQAPCMGQGKEGDYLSDGKLKETLEIRDLQGGFAGFTGKMWKIEPDGKWMMGSVFRLKVKDVAQGKLSEKELADLAKELARFDASNLKDQGKVTTNPHVVRIKWGKHEAALTLGAGQKLPAADAKTIEGRFS